MPKTGVIIQARMGSTRLPGKVMKKLFDKTVLSHVIERVKQIDTIEEIIIATSTLERDKIIVNEAVKCGVEFFRGSENNLLSRYYNAAKKNNINNIVRITSDCPLIDPIVSNEIIEKYLNNNYVIVTNGGSKEKRTYPRGLDTSVFSFQSLKDAYINATEDYQREHVTPHIYETTDKKDIYYFQNDIDYSNYRLTLDEKADWKLIKKIYKELYSGEHNFYLSDIIQLLQKNPELPKIKKFVKQKKKKK